MSYDNKPYTELLKTPTLGCACMQCTVRTKVLALIPAMDMWGMWWLSLMWTLLMNFQTGLCYLMEETECPVVEDTFRTYLLKSQPYYVPAGTPFRSMQTLPASFDVELSSVPSSGMGLYTNIFLQKYTWLGEFEGEYIPIELGDDRETYDYAWRVQRDGEDDRLIDAMDESLANWLRYLQCARRVVDENVEMTMCYGRIYFRTNKHIAPGSELLIYCGDNYSETYLDINRNNYLSGSDNETKH